MQILNSLKLFRFVAVWLVVYNHVLSDWLFGSFTVDAFFVLSGYMMAMVAENNKDPKDFAIGRITRIIPLFWMTSIALFCVAFMKPELLKSSVANIEFLIKSLLFIPFFKSEGNITPFYTLTWTLLFEMYFYLCVLAGMIVTARYFPKVNVSIMTTIIALIIYGVAHLFPDTYAFAIFFKSQNFLQSLLGLAAYEIVKRFSYDDSHIRKYYVWLILLTVASMAYIELYYMPYRLFALGIPCVILLVLMVRIEESVNRLPSWFMKPMIEVSDASYAIYLTHMFAFYAVAMVVPHKNLHSLVWVFVVLIASSTVGVLVHHIYDVPVTKFLRKKARGYFMPKPTTKVA
jgi:exopolysaccharide production protein ExoZ